VRQNDYYRFIREKKIKENSIYSSYNFRYKKHEAEYERTEKVASGTPSIFNDDCFRFIEAELPVFLGLPGS
jgi:hypothetical protein